MTDYTLITGASRGIGRAIALQLASSHDLLLCARSAERLASVRAECANAEKHLVFATDLLDPAAASESLLSLLRERDAKVAHFIHSAGIFEAGPIRAIDPDAALRMFNVNFFSAVEIVRQLSRKRVNGDALHTVTFISSIASRIGVPGYHVYAATKGALNALARSLAVELAPRIRVNCVLPGSVETEGTKLVFADDAARKTIADAIPLGLGDASDVATVVAFLISDGARWITGQEIVVDGGRSIV